MMEDLKKHVQSLIEKAGKADQPKDALRFSQAAFNAANAICSLKAAGSK